MWASAIPSFRYTVGINILRRTIDVQEMRAWCRERFGSNRFHTDDNGVVWVKRTMAWRHHSGGVSFRHPNDAFEFKIRWGGQ